MGYVFRNKVVILSSELEINDCVSARRGPQCKK